MLWTAGAWGAGGNANYPGEDSDSDYSEIERERERERVRGQRNIQGGGIDCSIPYCYLSCRRHQTIHSILGLSDAAVAVRRLSSPPRSVSLGKFPRNGNGRSDKKRGGGGVFFPYFPTRALPSSSESLCSSLLYSALQCSRSNAPSPKSEPEKVLNARGRERASERGPCRS